MKKRILAGAVALASIAGGLVLVATPASAIGCGITDAWDNSSLSGSTQLSLKGCQYYKGQAHIVLLGSDVWSAFGTVASPNPATTSVWTYSKNNYASTNVTGSHTQFETAPGPRQNGGYLTH